MLWQNYVRTSGILQYRNVTRKTRSHHRENKCAVSYCRDVKTQHESPPAAYKTSASALASPKTKPVQITPHMRGAVPGDTDPC